MVKDVWQSRVEQAARASIQAKTFAAFNANVDVVVHVSNEDVQALTADDEVSLAKVRDISAASLSAIQDKDQFVAVLREALADGRSFYIVLENTPLLLWLEQEFAFRKESMGGQAGIIANQMAALNAESVVYTPLLSPKQADMFFPEVKTPISQADGTVALKQVQESASSVCETKINWIFEYGKGRTYYFGDEKIITPRANRVIVATRPEGLMPTFDHEMSQHLSQLGREVDVAFMAGYHYAPDEPAERKQFLDTAIAELHALKQDNPNLRMHFEYVHMKNSEAERETLSSLAQEIQSFGINENELRYVLRGFGYEKEAQDIEQEERAFSLYRGACRLLEALPFERIQLHNLGYYIVLLRKPYPVSPEQVREACLFASCVNAIKAQQGGYVRTDQVSSAASLGLSDLGYQQLEGVAAELSQAGSPVPENFMTEGILDQGDHYAVFVPAHVVPDPVSTVGMGDTISSTSYACEISFVHQY